jgi:cysteinyl-tRNA synthetase
VCGITVYDFCHAGHARMMTCFDVIIRYLRSIGYEVNYVRNVTDIDDKIIARAQEKGEEPHDLAKRFTIALAEDERALNLLEADNIPHATEYISQMLELIEKLMTKKLAYVGNNGDVFYSVKDFPEYGKLSHKDLEGQEAGARIKVEDAKRDALDFVLWKKAKEGEPSWESPWGKGRPGWHIECSAMAAACLGETIDIHGGGFDLQFPHHENEIAQSEGATHKPFANYWMHVGFLQINKEKMSKSLGNFFTIREVLNKFHPETVRYFLLSSHYRSQQNYSEENIMQAHQALERLYNALWGLVISTEIDAKNVLFESWDTRFHTAMLDDFNVPEALSVLFDLSREINRLKTSNEPKKANQLGGFLVHLMTLLGLYQQSPDEFLKAGISMSEREEIEQLIAARGNARQAKNWAEADQMRDRLKDKGIELADTPTGTIWRKSHE